MAKKLQYMLTVEVVIEDDTQEPLVDQAVKDKVTAALDNGMHLVSSQKGSIDLNTWGF